MCTNHRRRNPAACMQHEHQWNPSYHHRQCPTDCCNRLLLCPPEEFDHPPAEVSHWCSCYQSQELLWSVKGIGESPQAGTTKHQWPTRTFHSRIIPMSTGIGYATDSIVSAVENIAFTWSTTDWIKPDWSTCAAKERVKVWDCTLMDNVQIKINKCSLQNKIDG